MRQAASIRTVVPTPAFPACPAPQPAQFQTISCAVFRDGAERWGELCRDTCRPIPSAVRASPVRCRIQHRCRSGYVPAGACRQQLAAGGDLLQSGSVHGRPESDVRYAEISRMMRLAGMGAERPMGANVCICCPPSAAGGVHWGSTADPTWAAVSTNRGTLSKCSARQLCPAPQERLDMILSSSTTARCAWRSTWATRMQPCPRAKQLFPVNL